MNKRQFISNAASLFTGALAGSALTPARAAVAKQSDAQIILTIVGAIQHHNRGKFDEVNDQLMHKHGVHFDRAYQFTLSELEKLPAVTIHPTMEYDARVHQLSGPLLIDVLNLAGIDSATITKILFHGIDGYSPEITLDLARRYRFIVATHLDGQVLNIGGFGPLFAIYDADRIPEMAQKPLNQRFPQCPWGLYCIEIA